MLLDEFERGLRAAAAAQPAVEDRYEQVVAAGRRRTRRRRLLTAGALVAVLGLVGGASVLLSEPSSVVESPPSAGGPEGRAEARGTPCPGSIVRTVDGGRPGADALPALEHAVTDRGAAEQVIERRQDDLRAQVAGVRSVEVGDGFGVAWVGANGGQYRIVEVDDVGIVVTVADEADCPSGSRLHAGLGGVPLFFFYLEARGGADRCAVTSQREVRVPSVIGSTLPEAIERIEAVGLVVVGYGTPDGDPVGVEAVVTAQEPPAGIRVPVGACVGFRTADEG